MGNLVNPRYACYCAGAGVVSVEMMLELDRKAWPGGKMTGFILWGKMMLSAFDKSMERAEAKLCFLNGHLTEEGHKRYDLWMQAKFPEWRKVAEA